MDYIDFLSKLDGRVLLVLVIASGVIIAGFCVAFTFNHFINRGKVQEKREEEESRFKRQQNELLEKIREDIHQMRNIAQKNELINSRVVDDVKELKAYINGQNGIAHRLARLEGKEQWERIQKNDYHE